MYYILFTCQLTRSCLPPEWFSDGHVQFSLRNRLLENNWSVLSLAYHLIVTCPIVIYFELRVFLFIFYTLDGGGCVYMYESIYRVSGMKV